MQNGKATDPTSSVEFAVDLHATEVVSSNNFQRCVNALWMGYYNVQYYEDDRLTFGEYDYLTSRNFADHFDTQRIKGNPPRVDEADDSSTIPKCNKCILYVLIPDAVHYRCKYTK